MCGICGIVDLKNGGIDSPLVEAMTRTLAHRGPDDEGVFVTPAAGLGHRRLSIIDLSAAGHQPMTSADGSIVAVYNGEIYNYRALREKLSRDGVTFRTGTDTEVAIEMFARRGTGAFARWNGMFAFAFWNTRTRTLHLVRDRFGIKPLYYLHHDGALVFGSEVKAILASGRLAPRLDHRSLHEYLHYGTALQENSLFAGVRKLLPGHWLRFDHEGVATGEYVSVLDAPPVEGTIPEVIARLREHLDAAVRRHLVADVPVGVFLSGGVDSSAITACVSRINGGGLDTYAVDFDFEDLPSELPKARRVAQLFGTRHHEMRVSGRNLTAVIESLVACHDEPFGDPADIPLYLLAREMRGSKKVVLQGDGGDEMFGGYRRYAVLCWERSWRALGVAARPFLSLFPRTPVGWQRRRFLRAVGQSDWGLKLALLMTDETLEDPPTAVLSPDLRAAVERHDPFAVYRRLALRLRGLTPVQRLLHADAVVLLPDIFLEKVDKSTMAHGLEVRVPFLDHELAAFAMGLPSGLKVRHGRKKWILREALRGMLPDDILDAPKQGFGVPYGKWLRGPLRGYLEEVLHDGRAAGAFDAPALERVMAEHQGGIRDNGFLLWKLLNLVLWARRYRVTLRA